MDKEWREKLEQNRKIANAKRNAYYSKNKERYKAKRRELAQTPEYKAKRRERYSKNPERFRATDRKWREKNIAQFLFTCCKKRAENAGIKFLLTQQWVEKRLVIGICERTGHSFVCKIGSLNDRNPWFPSIDRIDSSLGYTKSNCQMVCLIYNLAKNKWTDAVMLEMATAIVSYNQKDLLE